MMPRGRPRKPDAMTPAERTAKYRASRPRRREIILSPEADAKVDAVTKAQDISVSTLLTELVERHL